MRIHVNGLPECLFEVGGGVHDEVEGALPVSSGDRIHVCELGFDTFGAEGEVGGDGIFAEAHCDEYWPALIFESFPDFGAWRLIFDDSCHCFLLSLPLNLIYHIILIL